MLQLTEEAPTRLGDRPFRFEAVWMEHQEFEDVVMQNWEHNCSLPSALKKLSDKLSTWNRDTFGNIFQRKKEPTID